MNLVLANTDKQIKFLYDTRTHEYNTPFFSNNPPETYEDHLSFIEANQGESYRLYIAMMEGEMVGYCQLFNVGEDTVEVGFAIHPDFHGRKYGHRLVEETLKLCKKKYNKDIILHVTKSNKRAIGLYLKHDFNVVELNDDLICMAHNYKQDIEMDLVKLLEEYASYVEEKVILHSCVPLSLNDYVSSRRIVCKDYSNIQQYQINVEDWQD